MKLYGEDFEGKSARHLFPTSDNSRAKDRMKYGLKKYLTEGGKVFIEFTEGARKGTIGELIISADDCDGLYEERKTGLGTFHYLTKLEWEVVAEGKTIKIAIDRSARTGIKRYFPGVLHFGEVETKWAYETKEKPKVEPVKLRDHFGTELEVGQVVLFMHGKQNTYHNRFGKIHRISDKGTIWVEMFKTRPEHKNEIVDKGVFAVDMFVLDGDLREKAMLAKLTHQ